MGGGDSCILRPHRYIDNAWVAGMVGAEAEERFFAGEWGESREKVLPLRI